MSVVKTVETEVYNPPEFCVEGSKLFSGEEGDWSHHASTDGFLRLKPMIFSGVAGVEGTLALAVPPTDLYVAAWEASKPPGVWDHWAMLGLTSVPTGDDEETSMVIFFLFNTFFDRPLEVVHTWEKSPCYYYEDLVSCWDDVYQLFQEKLGATTLSGKKWGSEGGTEYDDTAPVE